MNIQLYQQYLQQYVKEAIANSDGTTAGISSYLWEKKVSGFLTQHKEERSRALQEARQAFDDHRHWPVDIVISHLGLEKTELES